jgi:hypothetical protein
VAAQFTNVPFLVFGDFNTGDNILDRTRASTLFVCSEELELLGTAELLDLWRTQHGKTRREYSWASTNNEFRIDHAFANSTLFIKHGPLKCQYDHEPRTLKITDHSALIIAFRRSPLYRSARRPNGLYASHQNNEDAHVAPAHRADTILGSTGSTGTRGTPKVADCTLER